MQLKKILFVTAFIFTLLVVPLTAQNNPISGKVLDASNGQPVQYANLGVVGTYHGTATDVDGNFSLDVKTLADNNQITVSAVGYRSKVLKISQLKVRDNLIIELIPVTYDIKEVDIEAPSRILYGLIKVAVRQISNNYLSKPYSARAVYTETFSDRHRQLDFRYADASGYSQRNFTDAFTSRRYILESGTRDFEMMPFSQGMTRFEELLKFDMMRNPGNVLDTMFLENFEVHESKRYLNEGKHILVLAFECSNPGYAWTGDASIRAMKGELHVVQEDLSILKTDVHYVSSGRSRHGRSFFISDDMKDKSVEKIEYNVETNYASHAGRLFLSEVVMKNTVFLKSGTQLPEEVYSLKFEDIKSETIAIQSFERTYYDDVSVRMER